MVQSGRTRVSKAYLSPLPDENVVQGIHDQYVSRDQVLRSWQQVLKSLHTQHIKMLPAESHSTYPLIETLARVKLELVRAIVQHPAKQPNLPDRINVNKHKTALPLGNYSQVVRRRGLGYQVVEGMSRHRPALALSMQEVLSHIVQLCALKISERKQYQNGPKFSRLTALSNNLQGPALCTQRKR